MYLAAIESSLQRILACLEGLDERELNWHPAAANANSLYALAAHTLANVERNLMSTFAGEPYAWDREAEFAAGGASPQPLLDQWQGLKRRIHEALSTATPAELGRHHQHPRLGSVPGRAVLLQAARHAAEHAGQAELTRDLLNGASKTQ
jgi:hypothetical protein